MTFCMSHLIVSTIQHVTYIWYVTFVTNVTCDSATLLVSTIADNVTCWPDRLMACYTSHPTCHLQHVTGAVTDSATLWSVATIADNVTRWPVDRFMATWPGFWRRSSIVSSPLCSSWHVLTETRTNETRGPENGFCQKVLFLTISAHNRSQDNSVSHIQTFIYHDSPNVITYLET